MSVGLHRRLWHSRTFRLGMLVTAFFVWLVADSFLFFSRYRTIHRGSLWDYSNYSVLPAGVPDESGSLSLTLGGGAFSVAWLDHLHENASYVGEDERLRTPDWVRVVWLPKIRRSQDAFIRIHSMDIPTWTILAGWLAVWSILLRRSLKRQREFGGR